ncbi:MAG: class I SAM-dependent methyltransferase [Anaerolineales bacterium]|nr:class I SAM-dependent methyltransferase [Anaerolineales bacterium]
MKNFLVHPVFDDQKVEPVSGNKRRLVGFQTFIRRFLSPIGLDVKVDITYAGSYILNADDWNTRYDPETGKCDAEMIARLFPDLANVLDIGCAVGRVEKFLAPLVGEIHGVDKSPKAIRLGRKYNREHPNCFLHVNNGKDLSLFEENRFDLVFSLATFVHMPAEDAFVYFVESFRCLKPGGKVLFQFQSLKSRYDQFAYQACLNDRTDTRPRYYTPDQLKILLEGIGYKIERIQDGDFEINPVCLWVIAQKPV